MAKFIISLFAAVAFCYFAEAATAGDNQAAINQGGNIVRQEALARLGAALNPATPTPTTPAGAACLNEVRGRAYREVNLVLVAAENQLRADAATRTPEELAPLTPDQLRQEVVEKLQPEVDSVVSRLEGEIANCRV